MNIEDIKSTLSKFNEIKNGFITTSGKTVLDMTPDFYSTSAKDIIIQNPEELFASKVGSSHDITKALHLQLQKDEFSERLNHKKMCHKCILLIKLDPHNTSSVFHASFIILNYSKKVFLLDPFACKDQIMEFSSFKNALEKKITDWKTKGSLVIWRVVAPSDFKFRKLINYLHAYEDD